MRLCFFSTSATLVAAVTLFHYPAMAGQERSSSQYERLQGSVSGFQTRNNDNIVDAAIVLTSLRSGELLRLEIDRLLSPSEEMRAGPITARVPGNLYVPSQRERWGLIPITLSKESFAVQVDPQQPEELVATWVKAPFNTLIDIGRDRAGMSDLLPDIRLQSFGFLPERQWSPGQNPQIALQHQYTRNLPYTWTRSATPKNHDDVILNFQKTPADRWSVTDLIGQASGSGDLAQSELFPTEHKAFFLRLKNDNDGNPVAATGHIRASQGLSPMQAPEPPDNFYAVRLDSGRGLLSWQPLSGHGWLLLMRGSEAPVQTDEVEESDIENFTSQFGLEHPAYALYRVAKTLSNLFKSFTLMRSEQQVMSREVWVDPSRGQWQFSRPIGAKESLTMLHISSSRPVTRPDLDPADEAQLFIYAQELRMLKLQ